MTAETFAKALVLALRRGGGEETSELGVRARGKVAVIGFHEGDEWVPLLQCGAGSGAFNVMSLFVRHGTRWAPTFVRGTPAMLAEQLLGPLRFTWEIPIRGALDWQRTSDPRH